MVDRRYLWENINQMYTFKQFIIEHRSERCYACSKKFSKTSKIHEVYTSDGQLQHVGSECHKHIIKAGEKGYQPPLGGPTLHKKNPKPNEYV